MSEDCINRPFENGNHPFEYLVWLFKINGASLYSLLFCTKLCCKSLAELWFSNGHRLNSSNQTVFFDFETFEKLFCLKDFSTVIDIVVLQSINQAIIFDYVNIFWKLFLFQRFLAVIDFIVVLHIWILIN